VPLDSSYLFERSPDGKYLGPPGLPAASGPNADVTVNPYDNVLIMRQPNWELQRTAAIAGEVRYPGRYSLRSKTERLSDLIERAGGITGDAYPDGVVFLRPRNNVGRIGIQLSEVLRSSRSRDNLPLVDGDSVFVPRLNPVVTVQGAVNSPVAVTYSPGKTIEYYIRAAGGPTVRADVKRAYVYQPNGKLEARQRRFLVPDGIPTPEPGSTVLVPNRDPLDRQVDLLTSIGSITQIVTGLVAVLIAVRR
jgi:polysaccharide export outer membrane protein